MGVEFGEPFFQIHEDLNIDPTWEHHWEISYYEQDPDSAAVLFIYDVFVRTGPPIDILFMTSYEFDYFIEGDRWRSIDDYSEFDTLSKEAECTVKPGSYHFVINHGYNDEMASNEPPMKESYISVKAEARPIYRV